MDQELKINIRSPELGSSELLK